MLTHTTSAAIMDAVARPAMTEDLIREAELRLRKNCKRDPDLGFSTCAESAAQFIAVTRALWEEIKCIHDL